MRKTKILKFDNGATLLYSKTKKKASAWNFTFVGGYMEDKKEGVAHFLEHMLLKNTKKRSQAEINRDMLEICRTNAYTSSLKTTVDTLRTNRLTENTLEFLSDIMFNTHLEDKYIQSEKGVIHEELNRELDNNLTSIDNYHYAQMYETDFDYPKGLGSHENIESMTKEELNEYRQRNYVAQNFIMSVVTKYPLHKIKKLYKKFVEPNLIIAKEYSPVKKHSTKATKPESQRLVLNESLSQISCLISIVVDLKYDELENRTVNSYVSTLIGTRSSKLFNRLREEGLIYTFSPANVLCYNQETVLELYFKTSAEKLKRTIDVMSESFSEIYENGMDESTFKTRTLNLLYLDDEAVPKDNILAKADVNCTTYINNGKFRKPFNWNKENKKLKLEYVNRFLKQLLSKDNKMYVTYLGNVKD